MEYRISQILRVHRAVTGQDQRELAAEIGIKQQALSQIERGMKPSLTAKKKIIEWMMS
jgi:DNA-binding XRE family transcriptional regulator